MQISTRSISLILGVSASFIAVIAYPNGRTPPQIVDISPVKATCEERFEEYRHEIFRARVTSGDESIKTLNILIGNVSEQIAIADIKTLTLPDDQVDLEGFMNAMLVRSDDKERKATMVQVRSREANLRLAGFRRNGTSISIDLSQCKTIEFSSGMQKSRTQKVPPIETSTSVVLSDVEVSIGQRFSTFVAGNWQWLWAVILVPAVPFLWKWYQKKRGKKPPNNSPEVD